jgi:hypothetical protein
MAADATHGYDHLGLMVESNGGSNRAAAEM